MKLGAIDPAKAAADLAWREVVANAKPVKRYDGTTGPNKEMMLLNAASAFITQDEQLTLMVKRIQRLADKDVNVLITGPSGTGKSLIAKILHGLRYGKLVSLNASGFHDNLFESELFGHEQYAFTGANKARKGKLLEANNGTLFLDEVGDLPIGQQVKLLKAIEDRVFYPLGSDKLHTVNCRLVFATNKDLPAAIKAGQFRADLFHRINTIHVHLPSLTKRPADALLIARAFVESIGGTELSIDEEDALMEATVAGALEEGNVRQLHNWLLRRFYITGDLAEAMRL